MDVRTGALAVSVNREATRMVELEMAGACGAKSPGMPNSSLLHKKGMACYLI